MSHSTSIFEKQFSPVYQALAVFALVLIVTIGAKIVQWTGILPVPPRFPWMTAASFLLLFAVGNSVFSLASANMMHYWGRSIYSFLGLAAASGLVAWLFSSLSINEAGSYRWIYVVVTVGYLVFLSIMAFMRNIVEFAQREEWNQPRIKRRK